MPTWYQPDEEHLKPIAPANRKLNAMGSDAPGANPYLRCQMPSSVIMNADSLRQFYRGNVPQYRIIPPKPATT